MGYLGKVFYTYGLWSAKKPFSAIFIGVVLIMIGSIGFLNMQATVSKLLSLKLLG